MFRKTTAFLVLVAFIFSTIIPVPKAQAQPLLGLPEPGTMMALSSAYQPAIIKGVTIHKDNPFLFDFIVDVGQDHLEGEKLKAEGDKLIKYFLASLAIPEKDLWVNLSPYEKDRTVPEALGQTDMGRDLLAQDYILKQITASLIYPEKELGKKFWDNIYAKAQQQFGTTNIPVNTFNKVWIMADKAEVFERNNTAFVTDSHLKVMLEEDYLATQKHDNFGVTRGPVRETKDFVGDGGQYKVVSSEATKKLEASRTAEGQDPKINVASQIVREIIIPAIEQEVNTGKNFATLRQIFNSIILASWYKNSLKTALLNQAYSNQSKVKGIDISDKTIKEQIYNRYLQAYKKGVFNYIKDTDLPAGKAGTPNGVSGPRKYFSGGVIGGEALSPAMASEISFKSAAMINNGLKKFETNLTSSAHSSAATVVGRLGSGGDNAKTGIVVRTTFGSVVRKVEQFLVSIKQDLKQLSVHVSYLDIASIGQDKPNMRVHISFPSDVSKSAVEGLQKLINDRHEDLAKSFPPNSNIGPAIIGIPASVNNYQNDITFTYSDPAMTQAQLLKHLTPVLQEASAYLRAVAPEAELTDSKTGRKGFPFIANGLPTEQALFIRLMKDPRYRFSESLKGKIYQGTEEHLMVESDARLILQARINVILGEKSTVNAAMVGDTAVNLTLHNLLRTIFLHVSKESDRDIIKTIILKLGSGYAFNPNLVDLNNLMSETSRIFNSANSGTAMTRSIELHKIFENEVLPIIWTLPSIGSIEEIINKIESANTPTKFNKLREGIKEYELNRLGQWFQIQKVPAKVVQFLAVIEKTSKDEKLSLAAKEALTSIARNLTQGYQAVLGSLVKKDMIKEGENPFWLEDLVWSKNKRQNEIAAEAFFQEIMKGIKGHGDNGFLDMAMVTVEQLTPYIKDQLAQDPTLYAGVTDQMIADLINRFDELFSGEEEFEITGQSIAARAVYFFLKLKEAYRSEKLLRQNPDGYFNGKIIPVSWKELRKRLVIDDSAEPVADMAMSGPEALNKSIKAMEELEKIGKDIAHLKDRYYALEDLGDLKKRDAVNSQKAKLIVRERELQEAINLRKADILKKIRILNKSLGDAEVELNELESIRVKSRVIESSISAVKEKISIMDREKIRLAEELNVLNGGSLSQDLNKEISTASAAMTSVENVKVAINDFLREGKIHSEYEIVGVFLNGTNGSKSRISRDSLNNRKISLIISYVDFNSDSIKQLIASAIPMTTNESLVLKSRINGALHQSRYASSFNTSPTQIFNAHEIRKQIEEAIENKRYDEALTLLNVATRKDEDGEALIDDSGPEWNKVYQRIDEGQKVEGIGGVFQSRGLDSTVRIEQGQAIVNVLYKSDPNDISNDEVQEAIIRSEVEFPDLKDKIKVEYRINAAMTADETLSHLSKLDEVFRDVLATVLKSEDREERKQLTNRALAIIQEAHTIIDAHDIGLMKLDQFKLATDRWSHNAGLFDRVLQRVNERVLLKTINDAGNEPNLAMKATDGGIDLKATGANTKVSKEGNGVEMNINPAMIERIKREGIDSLTPVIFRITPVLSIWPLVGLEPPKPEDIRLSHV